MIAFAYLETGPKFAAMYRTLAEGLCKNIREYMPDEEIMLVTDDRTPLIKGVNCVLRVEQDQPLMTWRLKAHQLAHSRADEILFVEPDVRFRESVIGAFDGEFDVSLTTREDAVRQIDKDRDTDFTLGMSYSRSAAFWREAKMVCQSLSAEDQTWFGDMLAVAKVVESGKFNVKMFDGSIYNHVVNDPDEAFTAKALHYKGKRKTWLFPLVREVAIA